jgi:Fe-S-cluster formation regulator IscX/YfhJ
MIKKKYDFTILSFVNMKVQVTALSSFEEKEEQFREQVLAKVA